MSLIDTSQWGEFLIGELFEIERPLARVLTGRAEGMIPFVSSGSSNNGVAGYVDALPGEHLDKGNCISVSAIDGVSFWQPVDFLGRGGSGASILLLRRNDLNDLIGTFLAGVITTSINASYTDLVTARSLLATQIKLPVTPAGHPDWGMMEQTMSEVTDRMATNLDVLTALPTDTTTGQIDVDRWGEFLIGELFGVERATRRTLNDYLDGPTPYVTNSVFNNGVSGYLQPKNKDDVEVGHCISVNSVDGCAFWQENDFLANSSGNGLILLRRDGLTEMQALFVCSAIEAVIEVRYAVMLTVQTLLATQVKLPVTSTGDPDWCMMEQTMREITDRMATNLDALSLLDDPDRARAA